MLLVKYPQNNFKIKTENNREYIFDEVRLKWVALTPEEWVRQNFLQYLLHEKKYPKALCAVEKMIKLGELKKRCDIVVYKNSLPWMIIECKEMSTILNTIVIEQILRYHMALPAEYLIITNGNLSFGYQVLNNSVIELHELPEYNFF